MILQGVSKSLPDELIYFICTDQLIYFICTDQMIYLICAEQLTGRGIMVGLPVIRLRLQLHMYRNTQGNSIILR